MRPIHTEGTRKRKRKFSLMFEVFYLILFRSFFDLFAVTIALALCYGALKCKGTVYHWRCPCFCDGGLAGALRIKGLFTRTVTTDIMLNLL